MINTMFWPLLFVLIFVSLGETLFKQDIFNEILNYGYDHTISFFGKANEVKDVTHVFFNTDPSISLSGLVPQKPGNLRLSDNLLLRLLPHCGCSRCRFFCSCCSEAKLDLLHIDTMVCIKVEYLHKDIGFSYSVTVNDDVYMKQEISAKNPPPVCFIIPTPLPRMRSGACIRIHDVIVDGEERTIRGCIKLNINLLDRFSSNYDLGCFNVNVKKNHLIGILNNTDNELDFRLNDILMGELSDFKVNETLLNMNPFVEISEKESTTNHSTNTTNSTVESERVYLETNSSVKSEENLLEYFPTTDNNMEKSLLNLYNTPIPEPASTQAETIRVDDLSDGSETFLDGAYFNRSTSIENTNNNSSTTTEYASPFS